MGLAVVGCVEVGRGVLTPGIVSAVVGSGVTRLATGAELTGGFETAAVGDKVWGAAV